MKLFLLGLVIGLIAVPAALWLYLDFGQPPVATGDAPFLFEGSIAHQTLRTRIAREMPKTVPLEASEDQFRNWRTHLSRAVRGLPRTLWTSRRLRQRNVPQGPSALATAWQRRGWR